MLFRTLKVYCTFIAVCVRCPVWLFSVVSLFRALSRYVARVFYEWFWDGSSRIYYYWYHFCFYVQHALYLYCKVFIFRIFSASFLITFLSPEIATTINIHVSSSLSRITMYGLLLFFSCGAAARRGPRPPLSWDFLDHTQRRITVGRTPLDEWSARRRDLYLTTHNTHNRQTSMAPLGFEPTISAGERPQTYALDRAATGTSKVYS